MRNPRIPKKVPIPPEDVPTDAEMQERKDALWMERYDFVCTRRTMAMREEKILREFRDKFGGSLSDARVQVRECFAAYVAHGAEHIAQEKEAQIRRIQMVLNHQLTIAMSAMKDGVPDYAARSRAASVHAQQEKLLGDLMGTFEPVQIKVSNNDKREVIGAALAAMTDEELQEAAERELGRTNGAAEPGDSYTTH